LQPPDTATFVVGMFIAVAAHRSAVVETTDDRISKNTMSLPGVGGVDKVHGDTERLCNSDSLFCGGQQLDRGSKWVPTMQCAQHQHTTPVCITQVQM